MRTPLPWRQARARRSSLLLNTIREPCLHSIGLDMPSDMVVTCSTCEISLGPLILEVSLTIKKVWHSNVHFETLYEKWKKTLKYLLPCCWDINRQNIRKANHAKVQTNMSCYGVRRKPAFSVFLVSLATRDWLLISTALVMMAIRSSAQRLLPVCSLPGGSHLG